MLEMLNFSLKSLALLMKFSLISSKYFAMVEFSDADQ